MRQKTLCQLFGSPPSVTCRTLRIALLALDDCLSQMPDARISWPNPNEIAEYANMVDMVESREPSVSNVFGFVDGVDLPVMDPSQSWKQNAFYNGFKCSCNVACVIVFGPDGCILYAKFNAPGSWHDSNVAAELFNILIYNTPRGWAILGDTAFPRTWKEKY